MRIQWNPSGRDPTVTSFEFFLGGAAAWRHQNALFFFFWRGEGKAAVGARSRARAGHSARGARHPRRVSAASAAMEGVPPADALVAREDAAAELSAALGGLVAARGAAPSPGKGVLAAKGGVANKENGAENGAAASTPNSGILKKVHARTALAPLSSRKTDSPVRKKPRKSMNRRVSFAPVLTETRFFGEDGGEASDAAAADAAAPAPVEHAPAAAAPPADPAAEQAEVAAMDDEEVVAASPEASPMQAASSPAPDAVSGGDELADEADEASPGEAAMAAAANFDAADFASPTLAALNADAEVPDSASPAHVEGEQCDTTVFIRAHLPAREKTAGHMPDTIDLANQLDAAGEPTSTAALPSLSAIADADEAAADAPRATLAAWRAAGSPTVPSPAAPEAGDMAVPPPPEPTCTMDLPNMSAIVDADEAADEPADATGAENEGPAEPTSTMNLPNMAALVDADEAAGEPADGDGTAEEEPAEPTCTMDLPNMAQLIEADEKAGAAVATPSAGAAPSEPVAPSTGMPAGVVGGAFNALLGVAQTPGATFYTATTDPSPMPTPADATSASPAPSEADGPSPSPCAPSAGPSPEAPPSAQSTGSAAMELTLAPAEIANAVSPASFLPGRVSMGSVRNSMGSLADTPTGTAGDVTLGITMALEKALEGGEHPRWGAAANGGDEGQDGTALTDELPLTAEAEPPAAATPASEAGDYGTGLTEELPAATEEAVAAPSPVASEAPSMGTGLTEELPAAAEEAVAAPSPKPSEAPSMGTGLTEELDGDGADYGTGLTEEIAPGALAAATDYGTGITGEMNEADYGTGLTEEIAPGALEAAQAAMVRPSTTMHTAALNQTYHTGATATIDVDGPASTRPSATYHTGATATIHEAAMEADEEDEPLEDEPAQADATEYHTGATETYHTGATANISDAAAEPEEADADVQEAEMPEMQADMMEGGMAFDAHSFLEEHGVSFRTDNLENARRKSAFPAPILLESPEPAPTTARGCMSMLSIAGPELRSKEEAVAELTRANASRRAAAGRHAAALAEAPPAALLALGPDGARDELRSLKRRCRISADRAWAEMRHALEVSRARALEAEAEKLVAEKSRIATEMLALRELAGLVRSAAASAAEGAAAARAKTADAATSDATAAEARAALSVRRAEVRGFAAQRRDAAARVEALRAHLAAASSEAKLLRERRQAAQQRAIAAGRALSTAPTPATKSRIIAKAAEVKEELDVLQGMHAWTITALPGKGCSGSDSGNLCVDVQGLMRYALGNGRVELAEPGSRFASFIAALAGMPEGANSAGGWTDARPAAFAVQALDVAAARAASAIRMANRAVMHPAVVSAAPAINAAGAPVVALTAAGSATGSRLSAEIDVVSGACTATLLAAGSSALTADVVAQAARAAPAGVDAACTALGELLLGDSAAGSE